MAQDIPRMSLLRRHLSPFIQFTLIAALALAAGAAVFAWPVIGKNTADQGQRTQLGLSAVPGTLRPTKEQWAGFKIEPVQLLSFRPEQVTEGSIAIDDDLTTPVFSPYSGRVIKLIAKLGDHVEPGAPLFAIQASEFAQAQNDLITAIANLQTARSQLV
jgi:cobalt-zinc-cadmium efflux system membrane fusion protein